MGQPVSQPARRTVLVRAGDVEFLAELADGGGPQTVAIADALSFDGIRDTIEAIGEQLVHAWDRVKPAEASVEFGLSLSAKTGKLTGLLVDAGGAASLKVSLVWKAATED